jgi:hypothetical protein
LKRTFRKGVAMDLSHVIQQVLGITPKTDTSGIRAFKPEEFRAFCLAGKEHEMTASRIHEDFKGYLRQLKVPAYVTDTVGHKKSSRRRRR